MKTTFLFCLLTVTGIVFFSCKKKGSSEESKDCKIGSITSNGVITTSFTYDDRDRVSTMTKADEKATFSYTATGFLKLKEKGNKVIERTEGAVNAEGLITRISTKLLDQNGTVTYEMINEFEYNDEQQVVSMTSQSGNNPEQVSYYLWSDGNMTSPAQGLGYTFYDDKPAQDGDLIGITQLLNYGSVLVKNKNQIQQVIQNGITIDIEYEYDSDGRITKCKYGNNVFTLQYICK